MGRLWYYLKLLSLELNEREFVSLCGILAAPYRLKQYCLNTGFVDLIRF
jgi:hypothetical protein